MKPTPGYWISEGGARQTKIADLDSNYLRNIIRKLERENRTDHPRYDELMEEAANRLIQLDGVVKKGPSKVSDLKFPTSPKYYPLPDDDIPF